MLHEKTSVKEEVLLFKSVKFSMSEAAVIFLKETGCLKRSKITLSNKLSRNTSHILHNSTCLSESYNQKSDIIHKGYLLSVYPY